jgi:hypothetical protein
MMQFLGFICFLMSLPWALPLEEGGSTLVPLKDIGMLSKFHTFNLGSLIFTGPHIILGSDASLGQLPWQAALYLSNGTDSWFCGGSIISKVWVLTAGHCVEG